MLQGTLGQLTKNEMLSLAAGLSSLPNTVLWKLQPHDMPGTLLSNGCCGLL